MPTLEPHYGCPERKLAQTNKEKLEAVLSKTPKLTLFASRNNIVAENPDKNITLQSIEASNQENQEVMSGGETTELVEVSSLESKTSNKQDSEGDNNPNDGSNDKNNPYSHYDESYPAIWGKLSAKEVDYWLSIFPHSCQNRDASLQPSKHVFNTKNIIFQSLYSPLCCQMAKRYHMSGCFTHHQLGMFSASVVNLCQMIEIGQS